MNIGGFGQNPLRASDLFGLTQPAASNTNPLLSGLQNTSFQSGPASLEQALFGQSAQPAQTDATGLLMAVILSLLQALGDKSAEEGNDDNGTGASQTEGNKPSNTAGFKKPEGMKDATGTLTYDEKNGIYLYSGTDWADNQSLWSTERNSFMLGTNTYKGPGGQMLVESSGGDQRVFKVNGQSDDKLFYWAPDANGKWQWNQTSPEDLRANPDRAMYNPNGAESLVDGKWVKGQAAPNQFVQVPERLK